MFFGGKFGAKRGMYVLLRWLWKWQGLVQREGQARQGCLSVCAQGLCKDAKPTKHTQPFTGERGLGIGIINQKFISKTVFLYKLNSLRKLRLFFYVRITNRHFFTSVCPIINEGHKNGYLS